MLIEISEIHIGGYAIIKNRKKKKWFNIQRLQVGPIDFMSPCTHMS